MKNRITIIVSLTALLISLASVGIVVFLNQSPKESGQASDAQSQDVLNSENFSREINEMRIVKGLSVLKNDPVLTMKADRDSELAATGKISEISVSPGEFIRYGTVNSSAGSEFLYFSSKEFLNNLEDSEMQTLLKPESSRLGVWVTYFVAKKDAMPMALVAVIVE